MPNTCLEHVAEDVISHALQRGGVLVAKPKCDLDGADLLALLDVADGAKFCRIQCKGRSLLGSGKNKITVPTGYVTDAFILILYIEANASLEESMFCFFGKDIREWKTTRSGKEYLMSLSISNYQKKLSSQAFNGNTIDLIKKQIINVDLSGEFKKMVHGYIEGWLPGLKGEFHGS